jgi:hypothetical protein
MRPQPSAATVAWLETIPGVGQWTAQVLVAEVRTTRERFPTAISKSVGDGKPNCATNSLLPPNIAAVPPAYHLVVARIGNPLSRP